VLNLRGTFAEHLPRILTEIGSAPTLFFLDPFGYRGIEMPTMSRIAERYSNLKTELLINFNVPKVDRDAGWLDSVGVELPAPAFIANVDRLMGTKSWLERYEQYAPVADRLRYLTEFYMSELAHTLDATTVSYPVRTISGQLKYHLIFVTRHSSGLLAMSDVIYRVDSDYLREQRDYLTSAPDRRAAMSGQASLWSSEELTPPTPNDSEVDARIATQLTPDILQACKRRQVLTFGQLQEELIPQWFGGALEKHYSKAVRELEKSRALRLTPATRLGAATRLEFLGNRAGIQPNCHCARRKPPLAGRS
jgi:hypothetical protein